MQKKLSDDARGIGHLFLLLFIVVSVAVFGTYQLIASRAAVPGATNGTRFLERNLSIFNINGQYEGSFNPVGIPNGDSPSWSHDGKQVVFWSYNYRNLTDPANGLYIANADGTNPKKIFTGTNSIGGVPKWSPDGTRIAFAGYVSSGTSIATVNIIRLSDLSLSSVPGTQYVNSGLAWAPDSNSITYVNASDTATIGRLCTISVTGNDKKCFSSTASNTNGLSNPSWSPNGSTIIFEISRVYNDSAGVLTYGWDIFSINRDGSDFKRIIANALQPDYSPDGTKIVYNACGDYSSGAVCAGNGGVKIAAASGAYLQSVSDGGSTSIYPQWQPIPPAFPASAPDLTNPTVSISSPINNTTISGLVSVQTLADDNRAVTKVEFYIDGVLKATDTTSPYCLVGESSAGCNNWDTKTVSDGTHSIFAKSYDAAGNIGQSATVSFKVLNAAALTYLGACNIANVPDVIRKGASFTPAVIVLNTGTGSYDPALQTTVSYGTISTTVTTGSSNSLLSAGASRTIYPGTFSILKKTKSTTGSVLSKSTTVQNGIPVNFSCTKTFTIPIR